MLTKQVRIGDVLQFDYHNKARRVTVNRKHKNKQGITGQLADGNFKNFSFKKMKNPVKVLTIPIV